MKLTINLHISWILAAILSWFLLDWQIALLINLFVADIKYKA